MNKASLIFGCAVFALVATACSGETGGDSGGDADVAAFCGAVEDLKASIANPDGTIEDLANASRSVADAAPEEISTAAEEMAAAAQSAADGDESVLDDMEQAETEVATYAEENC